MNLKFAVFSLLVMNFFCGCGHSEAYDSAQINKASILNIETSKKTKVIYFDYDRRTKRLIKKLETINATNPNKLEIAVSNFLSKTNFRGDYHQLVFDFEEKTATGITLHFSGKYDFDKKEDQVIFNKALELTIANYTDMTNINLVFNHNKF